MTEEEWRTCDNPARMRGALGGRASPGLSWVRFDLACIARVHDLIDHQGCLDCIQAVASCAEQQKPSPQWYMLGQHEATEAIRRLWLRRNDPLRNARIAAFRAVA